MIAKYLLVGLYYTIISRQSVPHSNNTNWKSIMRGDSGKASFSGWPRVYY